MSISEALFPGLHGQSGGDIFYNFDTLGGNAPSLAGGLTGQTGADAAIRGAEIQAESAERGIAAAEAAQLRLEEGLDPFTQFGLGFADPLRQSLMGFDPNVLGGQSGRAGVALSQVSGVNPFGGLTGLEGRAQDLFGLSAGEAIMQDPVLQAINEQTTQQIMNQQAARGRAGASETPGLLQQNLMRNAQDFLGTEREQTLGALIAGEGIAAGQRGELMGASQFEQGLAQQRRNELLNALIMGQSSAAQTGAAGLGTAGSVGSLLTQAGNAAAAGGIGAAQAQAQGLQNMAGLGMMAASFFSDRRVKKNIKLVGKYKDYNTYEYEYLWSPQKYIGVMAQEVEEVNPDAVTEVNGIKMVNYGAL